MNNKKLGWFALSPLLLFLIVYLLSAIVVGDFYAIPISSAFLISAFYAFIITPGKSISDKLSVFSKGATDENIFTMIWIFILAGAFASTAKSIGCIDATVNFILSILPGNLIYAGLFVAACFVSFAVGTSVGTIVALMPVANEIAVDIAVNPAFMAAIIVGGSFFGDNMSLISDTTIAATRTQGCQMKDKFKENLKIVAPAALVVLAIYIISGLSVDVTPTSGEVSFIKMIPYILVIALALSGVRVVSVLTIGILLNGVIGMITGSLKWSEYLSSIGAGINSMGELIIVTLLAGGVMALIKYNGGIDVIINSLTKNIKGTKGAQLSIASLVAFANVCTANNTIAIITTGGIANDISKKFGVSPRRAASVLDTISCFVQSLVPYGAQLLMAASFASISSVEIIPYLYYPLLMGVSSLLWIFFSKK